jgi:uncharacterized damage-inducible protein DinB
MAENNPKLLELFDYWLHIRDQFDLAVKAIPDDKLNWKPKGVSQSFRDVINDAIKKTYWGLSAVNENFNSQSFKTSYSNKKDLLIELERSRLQLFTLLANLTIKDLSKPVKLNYGKESTLKWLLFNLLEHDIYSKTRIYLLLNLMGVKPPQI